MKNHTEMKAAGYKVWPTYRMNEKVDKIVMTAGNLNEQFLLTLGVNTIPYAKELKRNKLRKLTNFNEFLDEVENQLVIAEQRNDFLFLDMYGFFLDKEAISSRESNIHFILADLDMFRKKKIEKRENQYTMTRHGLKLFLDDYVMPK